MANKCCEAAVSAQGHPTDTGGQIFHRFVNNFHIHQSGERTVCGNCGDEKTCLRCSKVGKKECEICGLWLSSQPHHFACHQRIHSGEHPYKCDQCLASFTKQHSLRRHIRIHTREMPYLCEVCGLQFRCSHHLIYHQAAIHSNKRPYDCNFCGMAFNRRDNLMKHKRKVHKCAYKCPVCEEIFGTRNEFSEHHSAVHVRKADLVNHPSEMESKVGES